MSNSLLTYALEGTTAVIRMDDGKVNALTPQMIDALLEALTRAEQEANAVVLAGREERFCAGFDLRIMTSGPENLLPLLRRGSELLMKLYGLPIPLVAACTGHALAGGALILLTADVRIGSQGEFRIGLNEVAIGMPVPVLAMELARDRIAKTELVHATLEAKIYSPEDAIRTGFLDAVTAPVDVLSRAKEEAGRLGSLSRMAFSATKTRLRGATIAHITSTLERDIASLLGG